MIHHLIGIVRKDIAALDSTVSEGGDLADLGLALDELRTARSELDVVLSSLEAEVVRAMGKGWEAHIDGLGGIKVHGGKKRTKWLHDDLFPLALRQARDRGPLPGTEESEGETVLRIVRSAVQPAYWRAKVLKGWGVDPDEFCEVSWGRKTVEIVR